MKYRTAIFSIVGLICLVGVMGCELEPNEAQYVLTNSPPETILAPTPAEGSMNNPYRIKLQWHGNDTDGRVVEYLYRIKGELFDDDNTETWYKTNLFFVNVKLRNGWYTLWVKAVDDKGAIDPTPDSVRFHIEGPTFDKGILLVDDDYLEDDDRDAEKDALYDKIMTNAGFPKYVQWDYATKFGLLETPVFTSQGVDLNGEVYDGLSAYSTVIWYFGGLLNVDEARSKNLMKNARLLSDYLDMGGNLWIAGVQPIFGIIGSQPTGDLFPASQFVRKYLHIRSARRASMEVDMLISAQYPEYPDILTAYINPRNPQIVNFLGYNEKTKDTLYCANQILPEVDAEVLYLFHDNVRTVSVTGIDHLVNSDQFAHAPCAIRYRGNYNVIVFGFPFVRTTRRAARGENNLMEHQAMVQIFRHVLQNEFGETPQ